MVLVQDRFVPRAEVARTEKPAVVLASPLRHFLLPPGHGELVYVALAAPEPSNHAAVSRSDPTLRGRLAALVGFADGSVARILGTPGEAIEVDQRGVTVNGLRLEEPRVRPPQSAPRFQLRLEDDEYFLARDVRDASDGEERAFLVVKRSQILGAVTYVLLPHEGFGAVDTLSVSAKPETHGTPTGDRIRYWLTRM
jgi:type IV secretory pathway protease TraF